MSFAKTKPITQSEPLKRLLFPIIKYDEEIAIVSPKQSPTINYEPNTKKSPSISWEALTPLEMVEKITSLVNRLDLSEKSFLATPIPELNHLVNTDLSNSSFDDLVIPTKRNVKRRSKAKGKKASILGKRSFSDCSDSDVNAEHNLYSPSMEMEISSKQHPWQINFPTEAFKEFGCHFLMDVQRLQSLICIFESLPTHTSFSSCYKRIRDNFDSKIREIHEQNVPNYTNETIISVLRDLLTSTLQKMNALIDAATKENEGMPFPNATHSSDIRCNSYKREKRNFSRKEFAHHMSNWLKENWTNPYPDDDEVDNIAEETGMKIDEVVNWLINARTRRWRPSIEKACDLLRPAAVLKEDSINIYEGKPVRQIDSDSYGYVSSPERTTCASEIED